MRRTSLILALSVLAGMTGLGYEVQAQMGGMDAHAHAKASTSLVVTGPNGKAVTFSAGDMKAMPHKSVTALNGHTSAKETYSGVALTDLLAKVGVPVGKDLKGKAYVMYVVAEGTDHYKVLYSLDEVDGAAHAGDVIVADAIDGAALGTESAFKLVSTEDKRPARWVRNLMAISVKAAE